MTLVEGLGLRDIFAAKKLKDAAFLFPVKNGLKKHEWWFIGSKWLNTFEFSLQLILFS